MTEGKNLRASILLFDRSILIFSYQNSDPATCDEEESDKATDVRVGVSHDPGQAKIRPASWSLVMSGRHRGTTAAQRG